MTDIIRTEHTYNILGVEGRISTLRRPAPNWKAGTFANQTWSSYPRYTNAYGPGAVISVEIRFDDECRNGHNTFAITAQVETPESRSRKDSEAAGCLHEDIAQVSPRTCTPY